MTDREKQVWSSISILLRAIRQIIATVPTPSQRLEQVRDDLDDLIQQLSDEGPEVC